MGEGEEERLQGDFDGALDLIVEQEPEIPREFPEIPRDFPT